MHIQITIHPSGATEDVPMAEAVARIEELSGRNVGAYVIDQAHKNAKRGRSTESAYVAGSKGHKNFTITVIREATISAKWADLMSANART